MLKSFPTLGPDHFRPSDLGFVILEFLLKRSLNLSGKGLQIFGAFLDPDQEFVLPAEVLNIRILRTQAFHGVSDFGNINRF